MRSTNCLLDAENLSNFTIEFPRIYLQNTYTAAADASHAHELFPLYMIFPILVIKDDDKPPPST